MESTRSQAFQTALFAYILRSQGDQKSIPLLCDLLHLNKSSIYARINGSRTIQLEEALLLIAHFKVPVHALVPSPLPVTQFVNVRPHSSARVYCQQIWDSFLQFEGTTNQRLWLTTDELSFFNFLHFRELALFKLFVYARVNWQLDYATDLKFDPDSFPEGAVYEDILLPLCKRYNSIPGTEYWTDNIYENALRQINYFYQIGQIKNKATALLLQEQMEAVAGHQYKMATEGRKWMIGEQVSAQSPDFQLYHNSMFHCSITIMGESAEKKAVFTVFDDPNFLYTDDPEFCEYTLHWMRNLQQKCVKISTESEHLRRIYFNKIREQIRGYTY
jgi:hypothetical protein